MTPRLSLSRGPLLVFAVFVMLSVMASAQDYRGKVQGPVTDPSPAAITGASVTLKNVNTGIESGKVTDSSGHYLFDFVQPGTYSITVGMAGFQKYVQDGVTVLTRGDVTVNASLTVGAVTTPVEGAAGI